MLRATGVGMADGRDWRVEAGRVWPVLVELAQQRRTITYKEMTERTGIFWRSLRYPLDLIGRHVHRVGLPPLTIVIVNGDTDRPGSGIVGTKPADFEKDRDRVFDHDWSKVPNPFALFGR
jgi:hypothetical protein